MFSFISRFHYTSKFYLLLFAAEFLFYLLFSISFYELNFFVVIMLKIQNVHLRSFLCFYILFILSLLSTYFFSVEAQTLISFYLFVYIKVFFRFFDLITNKTDYWVSRISVYQCR